MDAYRPFESKQRREVQFYQRFSRQSNERKGGSIRSENVPSNASETALVGRKSTVERQGKGLRQDKAEMAAVSEDDEGTPRVRSGACSIATYADWALLRFCFNVLEIWRESNAPGPCNRHLGDDVRCRGASLWNEQSERS